MSHMERGLPEASTPATFGPAAAPSPADGARPRPALELSSDLLSLCWRERRMIAAITLATALASGLFALGLDKRYESVATVALRSFGTEPLGDGWRQPTRVDDPVSIESAVEALRSPTVMAALARDPAIVEHPRWRRPSWLAQARESVLAGAGLAETSPEDRYDDDLEQLRETVGVWQVGLSRVIGVRAETIDPDLAALIANRYVAAALEETSTRDTASLRAQVEALREREAALAEALADREGALAAFLAAATILPDEDDRSLGDVVQAVEASYIEARVSFATAEARHDLAARALEEGGALPESGGEAGEEALWVQTMRSEEVAATARLERLRALAPNGGAQVRAAERGLAHVRAGMKVATERVVELRRRAMEIARAHLASVSAEREAVRARQREIAAQTVQAAALRRTRDAAADIHGKVATTLNELEVVLATYRPSVELAAAAEPPLEANGPSRTMATLLGTFGGGLLAVMLAIARDLRGGAVRWREHVESAGAPVIGEFPRTPRRTPGQDLLVAQPDGAYGRAARAAIFEILRAAPPRREMIVGAAASAVPTARSVFVTAPGRREDKTALAIALARAAALDGRRALVLDADRAEPRLAELSGSAARDRLSQVSLPGLVKLSLALRRDVFDLFDAGAPLAAEPRAPIVGEAALWRDLLRSAGALYDVVFVDGPPCLDSPDARVFAELCDSTLIVAAAGATDQAELRAATDRLRASGAQRVGAALIDLRGA